MSSKLQVVALLLCFLGVAFFAGFETGALSATHTRLLHRVRSGSKAARLLSIYLGDLPRLLTTTLVGSNLMTVMLSTISAGLSQKVLPGMHIAQALWSVAMAVMVLLFAEYLPKLFFTTRPLRRTIRVVRVFYFADRVLMPITELVSLLTRWLVPQSAVTGRSFMMTRDLIHNVVSDPKDGSQLTAFERLMINRVLTLQSRKAEQLMTAMQRVVSVRADEKLEQCYQRVSDSGHIRLPVFSEDGRRCVGVVNTLEALALTPCRSKDQVRLHMRPAHFVAPDLSAAELLPLMRHNRQRMLIVGSAESGQAIGIITEENIVAALTGGLR